MDYALFDAEELYALAQLDAQSGRIDQALEKSKYLLGLEEAGVALFGFLARLYAQIGLYQKSKYYYQLFLEADPDAEVERFQLGMVSFDMGESEKALQIWEQLLKHNPLHPPSLFYTSLVKSQLGLIVEAKSGLSTLIRSISSDNLYFTQAKALLEQIGELPLEAGISGHA